MTHSYTVTGMTCTGCEAKVKNKLLALPDVTAVEVSKDNSTATISMDKHIPLTQLQEAIGGMESKYHISSTNHNEQAEQVKGGLATYKPLLLVFAFITVISIITSVTAGQVSWGRFMNNFMAGFFIVFSFFKLLDVKAFAESYAMYDVLAMRVKVYGFIYPFIELALGLFYITGFFPAFTNVVTIVVMGFSSIGVIRSVVNKQQIKCACLGAVFNLPMSTVTIIEDLLMVMMAGVALFTW